MSEPHWVQQRLSSLTLTNNVNLVVVGLKPVLAGLFHLKWCNRLSRANDDLIRSSFNCVHLVNIRRPLSMTREKILHRLSFSSWQNSAVSSARAPYIWING